MVKDTPPTETHLSTIGVARQASPASGGEYMSCASMFRFSHPVPATAGIATATRPSRIPLHAKRHCNINIATSTYLMRSVRFVWAAAECRWLEMISRTSSGFIAYAGGWVHSPTLNEKLFYKRSRCCSTHARQLQVARAHLWQSQQHCWGAADECSKAVCICGCCHEMREQRNRKVAAEVPACQTGRGRRAAAQILPAVLRLPRAVCL